MNEKNRAYLEGLRAIADKTYFSYVGKKYIGRTRTEFMLVDEIGITETNRGYKTDRVAAKVFYSLIENPVFIQDKTTEEYLELLIKGEDCYCNDGKISMQVNTTVL